MVSNKLILRKLYLKSNKLVNYNNYDYDTYGMILFYFIYVAILSKNKIISLLRH